MGRVLLKILFLVIAPLMISATFMESKGINGVATDSLQCPRGSEIDADDFLTWLGEVGSPRCSAITIRGDLDFRSIPSVETAIRCIDCVIEGSIFASDVVFEQIVDLSGAQISGQLDLNGAVFKKALLMGSTEAQLAKIEGNSDLSLAVFENAARFDATVFVKPVKVASSRFLRDVSLDKADFIADADFSGATFEMDLILAGASLVDRQNHGQDPCMESDTALGRFCGQVTFERARFLGSTDFGQRYFADTATFDRSASRELMDFTQAEFANSASFNFAQLRGGASFRGTTFGDDAYFQWVTAANTVQFVATTFMGNTSFFGFTSTGALHVQSVIFAGDAGDRVNLSQISAADFRLDTALVEKFQRNEIATIFLGLEEALQLVEETARAREDLTLANEAKYQFLALPNEGATFPKRQVDFIYDQVYRHVFGYLVRPTVPLSSLIISVFVAVFIRVVVRFYRWNSRKTEVLMPVRRTFVGLFQELASTIKVAASLKSNIKLENPDDPMEIAKALLRWIEFLVYKILLSAFVLGLANANPTARQLIETVIKGAQP